MMRMRMRMSVRFILAAVLPACFLPGRISLAARAYQPPSDSSLKNENALTALDVAMKNLQPEAAKLLVAGDQDISI